MILLPPRLTRTDTLFPYTTLFRSAFFARNNIQIWSVDVDEDLNVFLQPIKDTGTRSAGSVRSYGNNDLFYLDDSGIRSIRTRDSYTAAYVEAVGTRFATLVKEHMDDLTDDAVECAVAGHCARTRRSWHAGGKPCYYFH